MSRQTINKRPKNDGWDTDEAPAPPPADNRPTYFLPGADIELVALAFYMSEYVDPGFNVRPGPHWEEKGKYGYYIKAKKGLDQEDIGAIKGDSKDWLKETRRKPQIRYVDSDTAEARRRTGSAKKPGDIFDQKGAQARDRHVPSPADPSSDPKRTFNPPKSYGGNVASRTDASEPSNLKGQQGRTEDEMIIDDGIYGSPPYEPHEKRGPQPTTTGAQGFHKYVTAGLPRQESRDSRDRVERQRDNYREGDDPRRRDGGYR